MSSKAKGKQVAGRSQAPSQDDTYDQILDRDVFTPDFLAAVDKIEEEYRLNNSSGQQQAPQQASQQQSQQ